MEFSDSDVMYENKEVYGICKYNFTWFFV